jgi:ribosomal subunit interface protein
MSLRISGKQMEIGDAFRTRINERIGEAVGKYFGQGFSGRVTVEKNGSRFITDCVIHLDSGQLLQATGEAQDPQGAFEVAADRIEKRLRRYKSRLRSHPVGARDAYEDVAYRLMTPLAETEDDVPEDYAPAIVAESNVSLRKMTVASAVLQLDMTDNPVVVFRNAGNDQINIVYRRADGNIGWVDPSQPLGKGA